MDRGRHERCTFAKSRSPVQHPRTLQTGSTDAGGRATWRRAMLSALPRHNERGGEENSLPQSAGLN